MTSQSPSEIGVDSDQVSLNMMGHNWAGHPCHGGKYNIRKVCVAANSKIKNIEKYEDNKTRLWTYISENDISESEQL